MRSISKHPRVTWLGDGEYIRWSFVRGGRGTIKLEYNRIILGWSSYYNRQHGRTVKTILDIEVSEDEACDWLADHPRLVATRKALEACDAL